MRSPVDTVELVSVRDDGRRVTVEVDLGAGGRLRRITLADDDATIDLLAAVPEGAPAWSTGWGSFPMAPWAGRVRHGRFEHQGHSVSLCRNHDDGSGEGGGPIEPALGPLVGGPLPGDPDERRHAIHGTVFADPWRRDGGDDEQLSLSCRLDGALGWPFGGCARQEIRVTPGSVVCRLGVEADPNGPAFPATIGWHPWFAKPDRLAATPTAMYERDRLGLPTGRLVPPSDGPWDDCFVNGDPVALHYDRAVASAVTITSDCDHLVLFDRPPHATCVEPQSGPPDALGRPDAAELVAPGHPLVRTMTISW